MENRWLDAHRAGDPDATARMIAWDREHPDRHARIEARLRDLQRAVLLIGFLLIVVIVLLPGAISMIALRAVRLGSR